MIFYRKPNLSSKTQDLISPFLTKYNVLNYSAASNFYENSPLYKLSDSKDYTTSESGKSVPISNEKIPIVDVVF